MRFCKKTIEVVTRATIKTGLKIKANPIARTKPGIQKKHILLRNFSRLFKLTNLNYIDCRETKYNEEFLIQFYFDKAFS